MELIRQGKVREVYADRDDVILVASDRVSVYDVVLPTPIPDKGAILTQLSLWWFRQVEDLVPNHVVSEDVPPEWKGRAIRAARPTGWNGSPSKVSPPKSKGAVRYERTVPSSE